MPTEKTKAETQAKRVMARFMREAMANLRPEDTGIEGVIIWVSSGEYSGTALQHDGRPSEANRGRGVPEGPRCPG